MPKIKVNTSKIRHSAGSVDRVRGNANSVMIDYFNASRQLDWTVKVKENIDSRLARLERELDDEVRELEKIKKFLNYAAKQYDQVDYDIRSELIATTFGEEFSKKLPDILLGLPEKLGYFGSLLGIPMEVLKIIINGGEIDTGDIIDMLSKANSTASSIMDRVKDQLLGKDSPLKELFGLGKYENIHVSGEGGWWKRFKETNLQTKFKDAGKTFKDSFTKELGVKSSDDLTDEARLAISEDGRKALRTSKGLVNAAWPLTLAANGYSNYEEYKEKKGTSKAITKERAVSETVTETLIDIGKDAAITAAIACGCALLGFAAPAVVVGGGALLASGAIDAVCKHFTGKNFTEFASDGINDGLEQLAKIIKKKLGPHAKNVKKKPKSGYRRKLEKSSGGGRKF
ncbi:MAG: hypothetical protein PUF16_07250 [Lachnospiraceae bacterium]|nr:hypothetical protein [Lachnospiraceae bacterium]